MLTVMAEEMGRLVGLAWGGVGVAVKLNNTVMNTIFSAATRLVQVLLLLTQKTTDLFTILITDIMVFLGDIGSLALTVAAAVHTLLVTTWGFIHGIGSGLHSTIVSSFDAVKSSYYGCISGTLSIFEYIGNALTIIKQVFVLFGSSILFLIGVIPNLLYWMVMGALHLCSCTYLKCCELVLSMWLNLQYLLSTSKDSFINFFTDIPAEAVVGFVIGIIIIFGCKYMIDHEIIVPEIPRIPSFILSLRPNVNRLNVFNVFNVNQNNIQPVENEVQDIFNVDEENDVNGNDNNGNVPDNNLPVNQAYIRQPAQVGAQQQHQPEVEIIEDNFANIVQNQRPLNNSLPVVHHILPRRPLTRNRARVEESASTATTQNFVAMPQQQIKAGPSTSTQSKPSGGDVSDDRPTRDLEWAYKLHRELEEEREVRLCVVCADKAKSVILLPCRHLCLCAACRSAIITRDNCCPICRQPIMETLSVFV